MEVSQFLGRVLGIYLVIKGLSVYMNRKMLKSSISSMKKGSLTSMMIASVATLTGLLLISVHNVWVQDWPVIITIFGWILFLKGSWFMLFPDNTIAYAKTWNKERYYKVGGLLIAIVGSLLTLVAF